MNRRSDKWLKQIRTEKLEQNRQIKKHLERFGAEDQSPRRVVVSEEEEEITINAQQSL